MRIQWQMRADACAFVVAALVAACLSGCGEDNARSESGSPLGEVGAVPQQTIAQVLGERAPELLAIEGVLGAYEGQRADGTPCIKVAVAQRSDALDDLIPATLNGHPVVIVDTGPIEPKK